MENISRYNTGDSRLKLQVEDPLEIWLAVAPVEGREVGSGYIPIIYRDLAPAIPSGWPAWDF